MDGEKPFCTLVETCCWELCEMKNRTGCKLFFFVYMTGKGRSKGNWSLVGWLVVGREVYNYHFCYHRERGGTKLG